MLPMTVRSPLGVVKGVVTNSKAIISARRKEGETQIVKDCVNKAIDGTCN